MKLPECYGKFGLTDDCYGCPISEDCERDSRIEEILAEEDDC